MLIRGREEIPSPFSLTPIFTDMAIDLRNSAANLSSEDVRARVSDVDIFKRYCRPFRQLGKKFSSELRDDPVPSAVISSLRSGIRYTDFGHMDHRFDSIGYVMYKYNCTFIEALRMIDMDFGLGLSSGSCTELAPVQKLYIPRAKIPARIEVKGRELSKEDALYWSMYGIGPKELVKFKVVPISHYWINGIRYSAGHCTYAYCEHYPRFKIYAPLDGNRKWYGNCRPSDLQGMSCIPDSGDRIILASSLKDVMVISLFDIPAIAYQAESIFPSKELIHDLLKRFTKVEVLYDNDIGRDMNPGQLMAARICNEYGVRNIRIPEELGCKDIAEVMEVHGPIITNQILNGKEKETQRSPDSDQQTDDSGWDQVPF